ncbi:Cyclolysin [Raoultella planticola]|uniref:Cyclolysin n=1 Tax=Raoultella planticola TaxID=575 RepID=A0A485D593_RAOPL|nr:Cyclolysin [Raoultella planticola]
MCCGGGKGNDQLKGGYGDDTYLFNAGDGQDTIIESSGADTLRLGEGLLAEQAVLSRQRCRAMTAWCSASATGRTA